jgi:hypothetical protein
MADVGKGVAWPIRAKARMGTVEPPTPNELRLIREVLDPNRFFLKQA